MLSIAGGGLHMLKPKQRKGLVALMKQFEKDKEYILEGLLVDIAYNVDRLMKEFMLNRETVAKTLGKDKLVTLLEGNRSVDLPLLAEFLSVLAKLSGENGVGFEISIVRKIKNEKIQNSGL